MLELKRAYDPVSKSEGTRFLVERLWSRGLSKARLHVDAWVEEVDPQHRAAASHPTRCSRSRMDYMLGDATLFARCDSVEATWRVVDPIAAAAEQSLAARFPNYSAGEWGPAEAEALIALYGAR